MSDLLHDLILNSAQQHPKREALSYQGTSLDYLTLARLVQSVAGTLMSLGLERSDRVAVFLEKRIEGVATLFGISAAGGVFVPVNPVLRAPQVAHILKDCNVRILVTSPERLGMLSDVLKECHDLHTVLVVGDHVPVQPLLPLRLLSWEQTVVGSSFAGHRVINADMAAILYTSGSTGRPKGVVLSHLNMVTGAHSVAEYLRIHPEDRLLSVLPLSFDYGLNQITTAFLTGACAVLINYLLPVDIVRTMARERITGLAAVPPLWIQLAQAPWTPEATQHLRYFTNSGGAMPRAVLNKLRAIFPQASPFLMYGLTEAFRSTYLPPEEVDRRPDAIGKAIPNAEILVVREDGSPCAANEPGELVHRGVLVSLGYWNDPEKTAERFKPVPGRCKELPLTEMAVWSGDTVKRDEEGFLYFVSRRDEMIKTSGYRVSPTELEEVVYSTRLVSEVVALGIPHSTLGQAIVLMVTPTAAGGSVDVNALMAECRRLLPSYMVPAEIRVHPELSLPRNPNGKIDRKLLASQVAG